MENIGDRRLQQQGEMFLRGSRNRYEFFIRCIALAVLLLPNCFAADLRLGIIGTDTSHAVEFTRILNGDPSSSPHVSGARVVAAFRGGSPDIAASRDRIEKFSTELRETWRIPFVSTISELCPLVDGILLESVDGRVHLKQFHEATSCGKPVFIDKPLASTLADALAIDKIAREANVPWFSSSSLRFGPIQQMRSADAAGAFVWGPGPVEEHHQLDLSWYGIHTVELLFTAMGTGVEQVSRTCSAQADVVTGVWKGGRIGTLRVIRPESFYGAIVYLSIGRVITNPDVSVGYAPLLDQVVKFMQTHVPPVPNAETLEIFRFMDAAQRSCGGISVRVSR